MYLAFFGMSSGGAAHQAVSPAAKLINLGYAFFVLLVMYVQLWPFWFMDPPAHMRVMTKADYS